MIVGVLAALGLIAVLMILVSNSRLPRTLKSVLLVALAFRAIGASARYWVIEAVYGGTADARFYYRYGLEYAQRFAAFDFSPFWDTALWLRSGLLGTQFVMYPTAFVLQVIGPSILGAFIVFSLFSFCGLLGFLRAFRNTYPQVPPYRYARWIFLFPALWFWPSSIGKEALLLTGLGLAVGGFVGRQDKINWLLFLFGLGLVMLVRPPMAAVVILSIVLAQAIPQVGGWTARTAIQALFVVAIGLVGINFSLGQIGVEGFDVEGVENYMEREAGASEGRSAIETLGPGIGNIPLAMINILLRPFPWEAGSVMMAFSAIEIWGFWVVAWIRRRHLIYALRNWRENRLLRMAVPFIVLYSITLGMMIANLGIIARQRVFLFPFLFVMIEAVPRFARSRGAARPPGPGRRPVRPPGPGRGLARPPVGPRVPGRVPYR